MALNGPEINASQEEESAANQILSSVNNPTQNIPIQSGANQVLSKFSGNPRPQVTVEDIYGRSPYRGSADEKMGFSDYYPGMENNILKGYSSGQATGSHPIYAPSSLFPFGLVDARQRALKRAADAKAAEQEAFARKIAELGAPKTTRTNVQKQITSDFFSGLNSHIDEAKQKYGNDYAKQLWNDPEFHHYLNDQQDRAANETAGVNSVAKFETEAAKEGKLKTKAQQDIMQKYLSGEADKLISSTDPAERAQGWKDMQAIHGLVALSDPQKVAKEAAAALQPDDIEYLQSVKPGEMYDMITTASDKGFKGPAGAKRLNEHLDQLYDTEYGKYPEQGAISKDEFKKLAINQFGNTHKMAIQTPSAKDGNGDLRIDENLLSKVPVNILGEGGMNVTGAKRNVDGTFTATKEKSTNISGMSWHNYYGVPSEKQKVFMAPIPSTAMNIEGKEVGATTGDVQMKLAGFGNPIVVHLPGSKDDGKVIQDKDVDSFREKGATFSAEPKANVSVLGFVKGTKIPAKDNTIMVNLDDVINQTGKHAQENRELYEKKGKELAEKLNAPVEKSHPSPTGQGMSSGHKKGDEKQVQGGTAVFNGTKWEMKK